MLAILNFLKDVNFTDQTFCRPGIQLDFEAFSINSRQASSARLNNLKPGTITPTQLVNNSIKKKVKQINFSADANKKYAKIFPKFALFWTLNSKLRKYFVIKLLNMPFLFTADKQDVCVEQRVVLAALAGIIINFTDQKLGRLKSREK